MIKKTKKGFTMIELLIVIFVLVVGLTSVLIIFPIGMKIGKNSRTKTIGAQLCQQKIEELISKPYNDVQLNIGTTTENYGTIAELGYLKRITRINYYNPVNFQVTIVDLGIKEIEVEVFWRSPLKNTEENINIKSFISNK
jgi:prepilin-type N-terminal cleavage/methylation domain-containing protein